MASFCEHGWMVKAEYEVNVQIKNRQEVVFNLPINA